MAFTPFLLERIKLIFQTSEFHSIIKNYLKFEDIFCMIIKNVLEVHQTTFQVILQTGARKPTLPSPSMIKIKVHIGIYFNLYKHIRLLYVIT